LYRIVSCQQVREPFTSLAFCLIAGDAAGDDRQRFFFRENAGQFSGKPWMASQLSARQNPISLFVYGSPSC
jgi:hypothetical protein